MENILKKYTQLQIAITCGVAEKTVYNWKKKDIMPNWAIKKMGFEAFEGDLVEKIKQIFN